MSKCPADLERRLDAMALELALADSSELVVKLSRWQREEASRMARSLGCSDRLARMLANCALVEAYERSTRLVGSAECNATTA